MGEIMLRMAAMLRKILLSIFLFVPLGHSMEEIQTPQPTTKITFPAEIEKLTEEISKGASTICIYIPNNPTPQCDQEMTNFKWTLLNLTSIKCLIIQHSLREDRGYSKTAVNALALLVQSTPNLEEITLSQVLADDLLPHLRAGIRVFLDFSCAYRNNDTIYGQKFLNDIRLNTLQYYQSLYPKELGYQIDALEIKNLFYK